MTTTVIGTIVILAELAVIAALFVHRHRSHLAEAESRRSHDRYRSVVDTQSDLVCRFRPDSTLTFVNDAYCLFWNKSREALLGTKFIELIPPAARQGVLERIGRIASGFDTHEHQVTLADGTTGWHHWINHAILDSNGHLTELQGVGRDITDRKRAEEALQHVEARNTAILRAIPDLMFIVDRDGTYLDYHTRDQTLLFAPPAQFIGRKIQEILPPGPREKVERALARAKVAETVIVEYTLPMPQPRHFEARLVAIDDTRVLSIVRDITDSKEAIARNRELAGRLIASQEMERTRIARELHDGVCQEMVSVTVDLTYLRQNGAINVPEADEMVRSIERRTARVAETLRLLSHGLHPTVLNHIGLVAALQGHCAEVERQQKLDVNFQADREAEPANQMVALSVYRIAQEALRNSVRHARARRVTVSLERTARDLSLHVKDDGNGFDPIVARQNGGLGLVSIEERARLVKGTVNIQSDPGLGTTVSVRVPADVADRVHEREVTGSPSAAAARRVRQ